MVDYLFYTYGDYDVAETVEGWFKMMTTNPEEYADYAYSQFMEFYHQVRANDEKMERPCRLPNHAYVWDGEDIVDTIDITIKKNFQQIDSWSHEWG